MQDYFGKVLVKFNDNEDDVWRVDDAMKGTSIIGGTGSGKTSGSGKTIALQFLKEGWGGVVLCAKPDEAKLWKEYCQDAKREKDMIIFSKGQVHKEGDFKGEEMVFNPIDYEMKREGEGAGETQNLTNIFMNIYKLGNRITGDTVSGDERYWDSALKRCLNRVIEIIKLADEDLTYNNMVKIIMSSNGVDRQVFKKKFKKLIKDELFVANEIGSNYCLYCLLYSYEKLYQSDYEYTDEEHNSFTLIEDYFTKVLPKLDDKTKAIVFESFLGIAEPFLMGVLRRHFAGATNLFPELTYEEQKIIILDFSIKDYLDMGVIGQSVFKQMFQQTLERRDTDIYPTPVFLWCDEAQYFVNPYDQLFLTTARSSRTATVFLSQNLSNYLSTMKKPKVDSLMGNLSTKIFHANSDALTNKYASELIGNSVRAIKTTNLQQNSFSLSESLSEGTNSHFLPQIEPREFTTLKSGGVAHNKKVQAVIMASGRKWSNDKNYLKTTFTQDFKD